MKLKQIHLKRYRKALETKCRFFLFDVDHNITNDDGNISEDIFDAFTYLLTKRNIGIGFVSARQEKSDIFPDLISIIDKIALNVDTSFLGKVIIFPEYGAYYKNIGLKQTNYYEVMKLYDICDVFNAINSKKFPWIHECEAKKTGVALWIKEEFKDDQKITEIISNIQRLLNQLNAGTKFSIINSANRTIDIIPNFVNKKSSIVITSELFGISLDEIATSDDQGNRGQGGFEFTDHCLGFATANYYAHSKNQISTNLIYGLSGVKANLQLIEELNFAQL